jgi:hypothetical protein
MSVRHGARIGRLEGLASPSSLPVLVVTSADNTDTEVVVITLNSAPVPPDVRAERRAGEMLRDMAATGARLGTVVPTAETQVRPLLRLQPDQQPAAWERAVADATEEGAERVRATDGAPLTARVIGTGANADAVRDQLAADGYQVQP